MISLDWNSYNIQQDEDGTQVTELISCSWQEYNNGIGLDKFGQERILPRIGTIYSYFQDPYLSVTNITVTPDVGKYKDIESYFLGDDQMVRMAITYSSDNGTRRPIRADQAASWDFKWNVELIDSSPGSYKKWTIPPSPTTAQRTSGEQMNWAVEWKIVNGEDPIETDNDIPDLLVKRRFGQLIFTCYSSEHFGYRFAGYLGKINRTNWSKTLVDKYRTGIEANKQYYDSLADYNNDLNSLTIDQYMWFFSDYEITEIRPKVIKNTLIFDFNGGTWDVQEGVNVNLYQTAEFNNLTEGMEKTEPPEEKE